MLRLKIFFCLALLHANLEANVTQKSISVPSRYKAQFELLNAKDVDAKGCDMASGDAIVKGDFNNDGRLDVALILVSKKSSLRPKKQWWNVLGKKWNDYSIVLVCILKSKYGEDVIELDKLEQAKPLWVWIKSKKNIGRKGEQIVLEICEKSEKMFVFKDGKFYSEWTSD